MVRPVEGGFAFAPTVMPTREPVSSGPAAPTGTSAPVYGPFVPDTSRAREIQKQLDALKAALAELRRQMEEARKRAIEAEQRAREAEAKAKRTQQQKDQQEAARLRDEADLACGKWAKLDADVKRKDAEVKLKDAQIKDANAGRDGSNPSAETLKAKSEHDAAADRYKWVDKSEAALVADVEARKAEQAYAPYAEAKYSDADYMDKRKELGDTAVAARNKAEAADREAWLAELEGKSNAAQRKVDTAARKTADIRRTGEKKPGELSTAIREEATATAEAEKTRAEWDSAKAGHDYDNAQARWNAGLEDQRKYRIPVFQNPGDTYTPPAGLDENYFVVPTEGKVTEKDGKYHVRYQDHGTEMDAVVEPGCGGWYLVDGDKRTQLSDTVSDLWTGYVEKKGADQRASEAGVSLEQLAQDRKTFDVQGWLTDAVDIGKELDAANKDVTTKRNAVDDWRDQHPGASLDDPELQRLRAELALALQRQTLAQASSWVVDKMRVLAQAEREMYDATNNQCLSDDALKPYQDKLDKARKDARWAVEHHGEVKAEDDEAKGRGAEAKKQLPEAKRLLDDADKRLADADKAALADPKNKDKQAEATNARRDRDLAFKKVDAYEKTLDWVGKRDEKTLSDHYYSTQYTHPRQNEFSKLPAPNYSVTISGSGTVSTSFDMRAGSNLSTTQSADDARKAMDSAWSDYDGYKTDIEKMNGATTQAPKVETEVTNAAADRDAAAKRLNFTLPSEGDVYTRAKTDYDAAVAREELALLHKSSIGATLAWAEADRRRQDAEAADRAVGRTAQNPSEATKKARTEVTELREKALDTEQKYAQAQRKHDIDVAKTGLADAERKHDDWKKTHPGADETASPTYVAVAVAQMDLAVVEGALAQGATDAAFLKQKEFMAAHGNPDGKDPKAMWEVFKKDPRLMAQGLINNDYMQTGGLAVEMGNRTQLKNVIGLSLGWEPKIKLDTSNPGELAATMRSRDVFEGMNDEAAKALNDIADEVITHGGDTPTITVVPVVYGSPDVGMTKTALFRVQSLDGSVKYIDDQGAFYSGKTDKEAITDYRAHNSLPWDDAVLVMPEDGKFELDGDGNVKLTVDDARTVTTWERVKPWLDTAVGVAGLIGGIALTSTGVLSWAGVAVIGASAYGLASAGHEYATMAAHGVSWDPRDNQRAAMVGVSVLGSALGLGALGSGARAASLAARAGGNGARTWGITSRVLGTGAMGAGGYSSYQVGSNLVANWDRMSFAEKANAVMMLGLGAADIGIGVASWRAPLPGGPNPLGLQPRGGPPGPQPRGTPPAGQQPGGAAPLVPARTASPGGQPLVPPGATTPLATGRTGGNPGTTGQPASTGTSGTPPGGRPPSTPRPGPATNPNPTSPVSLVRLAHTNPLAEGPSGTPAASGRPAPARPGETEAGPQRVVNAPAPRTRPGSTPAATPTTRPPSRHVDRVDAPGLRENFGGLGPDEPASVAIGFDGTWSSGADPSHVLRLLNHYEGDAAFYVRGVGTGGGRVDKALGLVTGRGWRERVDAGVDSVVRFAAENPGRPVTLDVFGFSRGAAQARVFANEVAGRVQSQVPGADVSVRFLGLFDTVSTGMFKTRGSREALVVPDAVQSAAHAVSLHEPSRFLPLDSIARSPAEPLPMNDPVRTEVTFASDHPAVGGHVHDGITETSQVTFHWMQQRARDAGTPINMRELPIDGEAGPVRVRRDGPGSRPVGERNVRFPATGTRGQSLDGMAGLTTDAAGRLIMPPGTGAPKGTHGWMAPGEYTSTVMRVGYFEGAPLAGQRAAAEGAQPVPDTAPPAPRLRHRLSGAMPGSRRNAGNGEVFRRFDAPDGTQREAVWYRPGSAPRDAAEGYARLLQQHGGQADKTIEQIVAGLRRQHLVIVREGPAGGTQDVVGGATLAPRWKGARRLGPGGPDRGVHVHRDLDGSRVKRGDGRLADVVGTQRADAQDAVVAALDGAQRFTRVQRLLWSTRDGEERSLYADVPGAKPTYDIVVRDAPDRLRALPAAERTAEQDHALAQGSRRKQLLALAEIPNLPDGLRVSGYEAPIARPLGPVGKVVKVTDPNSYLGRLNGWVNPVGRGIAGVRGVQQRLAQPVEIDTAKLSEFEVKGGGPRRTATLVPPGKLSRAELIDQAERVAAANRGLPGSPYAKMSVAEIATQLDGLHIVRVTETGADGQTRLMGGASIKANWKGSDGTGRWLAADLPHRASYLGHVFGERGGGGQATQAAGAAAARLRAPELDFYTRWTGAHGLYARLEVPVADARFTPEAPRLLLDADPRTLAALPHPLREAVTDARTRPAGEQEAALKQSLDTLEGIDFHTSWSASQQLYGKVVSGRRDDLAFTPIAAKKLLTADTTVVDGLPAPIRDAVTTARALPDKAERQTHLQGELDAMQAAGSVPRMLQLSDGVLRVSYRQPLDVDPRWYREWSQGAWGWATHTRPATAVRGQWGKVLGRPTLPTEIQTFPAFRQTSGVDRRATLYPPGTLSRRQLMEQAEQVLVANEGLPGSPYARMNVKQVADELDSLYVVRITKVGTDATAEDGALLGGAAVRRDWKGPKGDGRWLGDALPAETAYLSHVFSGGRGAGEQATAAGKTAAATLRAQDLAFYTRWYGAQGLYQKMNTPVAETSFTPKAPDLLLATGPAAFDALPSTFKTAITEARAQPAGQQRAHLAAWLDGATTQGLAGKLPNGVLRVSYRVPMDEAGPWSPHWTQRLRQAGGKVKPGVQATGRGLSRLYEGINPHAGPKQIEAGPTRQALRDASHWQGHVRRTALKYAVAPWAVANAVQLVTGQAVIHHDDDRALVPFNALQGSESVSIHFPWTRTTLSLWATDPALRGLYGLGDDPAQPMARYGASPVNPNGPKSATGVQPARVNAGEWAFGLQIGNNEYAWRAIGGFRLFNGAYNNRADLPTEKGGTKGFSMLTSLTPIQPSFSTGLYAGPGGVINRDMMLILGPAMQSQRLSATAAAGSSAIYAQRHGHIGGRVSGSQGTFLTLNPGHGQPEPEWSAADPSAQPSAPDSRPLGPPLAMPRGLNDNMALVLLPQDRLAALLGASPADANIMLLDGTPVRRPDSAERMLQSWKNNVNVLG